MASEYGWSKRQILNDVYLDELFELVRYINIRKISAYKMQLAIVSNPHIKDPKALAKSLDQEERKLKGIVGDELDVVGMELLKQRLKQNSRIEVK